MIPLSTERTTLMSRDFEKDPIVLRATVEVYVYESVEQLEQQVISFNTRRDVQEAALNLVGGFFSDSCGLNVCKVEIK
jgi:hypothetical protein